MSMDIQLRKYRRLAGLDQQEVADALGVKKRTYGSWERGEVSISLANAYDCAKLLGCSIDELAGYSPSVKYSDPKQEALNGYYESMNDGGRDLLVQSAKSISADPERRIVKDRPEVHEDKRQVG